MGSVRVESLLPLDMLRKEYWAIDAATGSQRPLESKAGSLTETELDRAILADMRAPGGVDDAMAARLKSAQVRSLPRAP